MRNGCQKCKFIIVCVFAILLSSCVATYTSTRYSNADIHIGESKNSIIRKYGAPYSEELLYDNNNILTEIIRYKEPMAYGYTLETFFYFQDSILVKKLQVDNSPSEVILKESKK